MDKKYQIFDEEDGHEYDLIVAEIAPFHIEYQLFASNNPIWADWLRGKKLFTVVDNGDGVTILKPFDTIKDQYDYDEEVYLYLILAFKARMAPNKANHTFYEANKVLENI